MGPWPLMLASPWPTCCSPSSRLTATPPVRWVGALSGYSAQGVGAGCACWLQSVPAAGPAAWAAPWSGSCSALASPCLPCLPPARRHGAAHGAAPLAAAVRARAVGGLPLPPPGAVGAARARRRQLPSAAVWWRGGGGAWAWGVAGVHCGAPGRQALDLYAGPSLPLSPSAHPFHSVFRPPFNATLRRRRRGGTRKTPSRLRCGRTRWGLRARSWCGAWWALPTWLTWTASRVREGGWVMVGTSGGRLVGGLWGALRFGTCVPAALCGRQQGGS